MKTHITRMVWIWPLALAAVGLIVAGLWVMSRQPKTDIRAYNPGVENFARGHVTTGQNLGSNTELKTNSQLTYEAPVRQTKSPTTNAVGLMWNQRGSEGTVEPQVRTNDGHGWSRWVSIDEDDRKDGAVVNAGIVLTENAKQVQYRFLIHAGPNGASPAVSRPRISLIDSTRGPDPTKPKPLAALFGGRAKATATGPSIYTREDWGCPDGESSPNWPPEYRVPDEVIVHHTAATVDPSSSAAAIRAIWDYHSNTLGWGDIGYNYLVDLNGNIWQGRFYNQTYARQINQDVVGGHAYGQKSGDHPNYHSVGVAALGNFDNQAPSGAMLDAIGRIAGWKAMPYGTWNPNSRTFGHRDVDYTSCPGNNLYNALPTARTAGGNYFDYYSKWQQYDYSYQGQGVNGSPGSALSLKPGQTTTAYLDLRNDGTATWSNQQVRLGTYRPRDRSSGFRDASWLSPSRTGTFAGKLVNGSLDTGATTIAPGETARFQFTVGNQGVAPGMYLEYLQPVAEGYTWFIRDIGINWQMTSATDTYTYQWMGQTYAVPTEPGQTGTLRVDAKNTGTATWHSDGSYPVRIGTYRSRDRSSALYDSSWLSGARPATFTGKVNGDGSVTASTTIAPGETARFQFTAQAPKYPYSGNEYFNLLAEGLTWMNDVGMYWSVTIPQSYNAQWAGQSAAPTISKGAGGIGSMYFDFKNTGTYPWRKSTAIMRLAPNHPNDHTSPFAASGLSGGQLPANTANWMSGSRVGTFAGKVTSGTLDTSATVINPGETARFEMALDARNVTPGTYNEYVDLVAEAFAWMPDIGVYLPVTVTP